MQRAAEAWGRIHAVKKRIHPATVQWNLPWRIPRETGKGGDRRQRHLGTLIPAFFSMESKEKRAVGPSFWTEEDGTAAMGSLLSLLFSRTLEKAPKVHFDHRALHVGAPLAAI